MNRSLLVGLLIFGCALNPVHSGEFVKKVLGHDETGKPIYQWVYRAGKSRFDRASTVRYAYPYYGYGYGYRYRLRPFHHHHVTRKAPRTRPRRTITTRRTTTVRSRSSMSRPARRR